MLTVNSYNEATTNTEFIGGDGMATAASPGMYNFGAGDAATSTDRAIGGVGSNSAARSINVFTSFLNSGVNPIINFNISYTIEKYKNGTEDYQIQMYFSGDGVNWTDAGSSFSSFWSQDNNTNGFTPAPGFNTISIAQTLNASVSLNSNLYLAWNISTSSTVSSGQSMALSIDDFKIEANYASTVPLMMSNFKLAQQSGVVELSWIASDETSIDRYEIERSSNADQFTSIGSLKAKSTNNGTYRFIDASPLNNMNYYRIKSINRNGNRTFTQVLSLSTTKTSSEVTVSPNPARASQVQVQMNNMSEGVYTLNVYSTSGARVYSKVIAHKEGSSAASLSLPASVQNGIYYLGLTGNNTTITRQLVIAGQ